MRAFRPRSLPRNLVKNPGDDCFASTVRSVSCATFNLSLFIDNLWEQRNELDYKVLYRVPLLGIHSDHHGGEAKDQYD